MFIHKQMKKSTWRSRIKKACKAAGTYQPFFDSVIDSLAGILETRDLAKEKFDISGGNPVILHTNKGGNTNIVKNPALVVMLECEAQALTYWKELGLTSKSYKQMNGGIDKDNSKTLEAALSELGI